MTKALEWAAETLMKALGGEGPCIESSFENL